MEPSVSALESLITLFNRINEEVDDTGLLPDAVALGDGAVLAPIVTVSGQSRMGLVYYYTYGWPWLGLVAGYQNITE